MSDGDPGRPGGGRNRRRGSRRRTGEQSGPQGRRQQRSGPQRVTTAQLEAAAARRGAVDVPPITYPAQLPVSARREDIAAAIRDHQVVIVAGETGSGKTTQIPKIALELGRGRQGQIGHTQPRRLAARTVAERIAEELGTQLGDVVGYQVRFTDQSSERTLVKVMTDGILLAQIQRDPQLLAYDTIIIDEAHERSLNIDFLLGYLSRLLPQRPDLKLVITSATIDSERFAAHFSPAALAQRGGAPEYVTDVLPDQAPVVEVSGRTYPVEIRYRPLSPDENEDGTEAAPSARKKGRARGAEEKDLVTGIIEACDELLLEGDGDILVFLSGEREIHDTADGLAGHYKERVRDPKHPQHIEVMPLYARLSSAEQHRVFQQHASRRIVLATNVAETSLTVPGIHYVVDPGTARISRYSKQTKVQRLPIEPVSQASANQRSGRSGRVADGIAIRLYSQEDFEGRPEFTEPEILRTSLASVLLQMISVGVVGTPDDVARFPFVEAPDTRAIRDGVQLLTELGALEEADGVTRLTETGRTLAQLPMDPRLARMVIEGSRHGVARDVAVVAAALSIQDPRERPAEQRAQADQLHARFADPRSDFLSYLNLWEYVREQQRLLSGSAFRRLCKAEYLNFLRIREWQDVVAQLRDMARPLGMDMSPRPAPPLVVGAVGAAADVPGQEPQQVSYRHGWDEDTIHRSLLAGLLSQIGMQDTGEVKASAVAHLRGEARERALKRAKKQARNEYVGARGARFAIFPGSPLSKKPPGWIMAGELVETSRLWARDVARIQPEWAEELAGPLARRTYSEPHWSSKQGAAMCTEKVLLYGVPIVSDRRVLYAKVDAEAAREMFVRHALVQGEWTTHHRFFHDNRALLEEAGELEARSRQRGLVADEDDLFAFYDERVPDSVVSAAHFDRWWSRARRETPDLLTFTMEQLVGDATVDTAQFPEAWPQGELSLPLTYQFQPGSDADGVTVHVPVAVLARVVPDGFDWMVPGLLEELTVATIKSLPKTVRRELVPAPDVAREVVAWIRAETPAWEDVVRAGDMAEPYTAAFARAVRAVRHVVVPPEVWDDARLERMPPHLRVTFRVVEERGTGRSATSVVLDESKDLLLLQRTLASRAEAAVRSAVRGAVGAALAEARAAAGATAPAPGSRAEGAGAAPATATPSAVAQQRAGSPAADGVVVGEQAGLTTWPSGLPDGGSLPGSVSTDVGAGMVVRGFPALVEEVAPKVKGQARTVGVALRILADEHAQAAAHAAGVRRLLLSEAALGTGRITSRWTGTQSLTMAASPYPSTDALVADLQLAAVTSLTSGADQTRYDTPPGGPDAAQVRSASAYADALAFVRRHLEDEVHRVVGHVVATLSASRTLEAEVRASGSLALLNTLQDLREHRASLVHDGFVAQTPPRRLPHLARYLRADSHRLTKAAENPARDADLAWRIGDVSAAYEKAQATYAAGTPDAARAAELADVRWMLEELRVSLFAQQLGTDGPVSEKRIRKVLTPGGW
ncbi:ATP-dependent helicase HrpA [Promicromonospora thailandica]|uniref:ATP-dependent helicase HrpA n=1 Tax=Promicromonospora thailandica TaxID=765201 RepID=A0A9X2G9M7_9MICO|nr:ATP-dependent RNA helicase HrpA [Promicromonospora thailandica]MCP2265151.1 ATP-dependent helicase HrpA [Promicromonospora thailandica]